MYQFCTMAEQHFSFLNQALVVASSVQSHFSLVLAKQNKTKQTNKRTWSTRIQNKKTFFSSPSSITFKWAGHYGMTVTNM